MSFQLFLLEYLFRNSGLEGNGHNEVQEIGLKRKFLDDFRHFSIKL